jgi:hypothetical protein
MKIDLFTDSLSNPLLLFMNLNQLIMIKSLTYYLLASVVFLAACNINNSKISEDDGLSAFSADSLRLHVAELSHD